MGILRNIFPAARCLRTAHSLGAVSVEAARSSSAILPRYATESQDHPHTSPMAPQHAWQAPLRRSLHTSPQLPAAAAAEGRTFAAAVIERYPVIAPELPEWEVEYQNWSHEKKVSEGFYKEYPTELTDFVDDDDQIEWEPAPRITHADLSNDRQSLYRALDKKLYLLFKGPKGNWHFPHAELAPGETGRQLAERAITEYWNDKRGQLYFIGNAPAAHFPIPGGHAIEEAEGGDTIFYYRASMQGEIFEFQGNNTNRAKDFLWVTVDELPEYFDCEEQQDLMKVFLKDL